MIPRTRPKQLPANSTHPLIPMPSREPIFQIKQNASGRKMSSWLSSFRNSRTNYVAPIAITLAGNFSSSPRTRQQGFQSAGSKGQMTANSVAFSGALPAFGRVVVSV
eukprot:2689146-Rhodomonas_salina.1